MLHLLGAGLILVGFIGGGIYFCEKEEKRLEILTSWKISLQILCNEIGVRRQPVFFAMEEIKKRIEGEVGIFYERVCKAIENNQEELLEIWKKELEQYLNNTLLPPEGKKIIEPLEEMLGYEDYGIQLGMLEMEIEMIDNFRKRIRDEKREKKKVILLLSTCSGAILILLLI